MAEVGSDISNGQRGDAKPSVESEQTNAPVSDGPSLVSDDRERLQKLMQDQYQNMSITPAFSGVPLENMDTLNKNLATNLRRMGYEDLLPIQTYSTSALLSGRSLLVCAPTGSGKTAAFLIPAIEFVVRYHRWRNRRTSTPLVLILGNTQNLMYQTFKFACSMAGYEPYARVAQCGVRIFDLFAGKGASRLNRMDTAHDEIVVATTGGVLKGFEQNKLDFSNLEMLIIDEFDKMVDEVHGFGRDLYQILDKIPACPTVAGFSATFSDENSVHMLRDLELKLFRSAIPILIKIDAPKGYITQRVVEKAEYLPNEPYWDCSFAKNMGLLVGLIESDLALHQMKKGGPYKKSTVIFVERRRTSNYLALFLLQNGYDFEPMNADYTLDDNENTLHRMKAGQIQGVVATNKLARGQDIPEVDHVIIYEMSADFSDYKHRIGRTGRMGRGGRSTVMLSRKADRALVVPLVEFMIYHNQVLPYWLWYLYYQKGDYETERDGESSESFVSAVSELPSESESDDNDSLVCSRRNSIP